MAFLNIQNCFTCGKETKHVNGKCVECSNLEIRKENERWHNLTLEEKVEELKDRLDYMDQQRNAKF